MMATIHRRSALGLGVLLGGPAVLAVLAVAVGLLLWYGASLLTLDPRSLDLSPGHAACFGPPACLLLAQARFFASTTAASVFSSASTASSS